MHEHKEGFRGGVQPIKFKSIVEENDDKNVRETKSVLIGQEQIDASIRRRRALKSNLALAFPLPAVTLENVCFSVDKSQQQSNFAKEVLFRLSNCLNPILSSSDKVEENKVHILKSVNLNVPYGSIFGLLGPSSCGKTTLLRCLVGLLEPSSGSIGLFGCKSSQAKSQDQRDQLASCMCCFERCSSAPSSRPTNCKVPGANVGYMPQDLGLYEDFSIKQLLTMFGRYMRMESELIASRIAFMAEFLELPDVRRQINTLSGGQKRRVSFAIACLHMPPLIILDEPTVGVDPLLRQSIWKYLRRLASEENKTIIITTHYIEEAAQADQVALMRAGEILVQDTPAKIMQTNQSKTLEEAFLKICNNVQADPPKPNQAKNPTTCHKLCPQPQVAWNELETSIVSLPEVQDSRTLKVKMVEGKRNKPLDQETVMKELKLRAEEKLALYDQLRCSQKGLTHPSQIILDGPLEAAGTNLSMVPNVRSLMDAKMSRSQNRASSAFNQEHETQSGSQSKKGGGLLNKCRPLFNKNKNKYSPPKDLQLNEKSHDQMQCDVFAETQASEKSITILRKTLTLFWALLYKNYRRNLNSIPLLAFQFMLPMIQMISFSLCVGGRPTNVGLGVVNHDRPSSFLAPSTDDFGLNSSSLLDNSNSTIDESLSLRYLSFLDREMLEMRPYENLQEALADVRRAKLWAVLEIGANFTNAILDRFDYDNFYQLDRATIADSVIKIFPDRSNKILDMICHRSLVDSYRRFLSSEFEQFRRLPIEIARPIFDIKPNAISNSIDGYTESIAPGLLASLTYIMAAGLTTFIMVVERSAGILERTYTSGINPAAYLLAHAIFRSFVMMLQIAAVLFLTFYVLQQPLVGSIWLAYAQLMLLNMTGIAYGLLISSIVADQNGAALTIVSSLVVKITLSGILWPFEAIPLWLRAICYVQPLTMPVQALKAITLKGATLGDRSVNLGFLVAFTWLLVFLTVSTKRFKFYQH